jgi:hypothetical protein
LGGGAAGGGSQAAGGKLSKVETIADLQEQALQGDSGKKAVVTKVRFARIRF